MQLKTPSRYFMLLLITCLSGACAISEEQKVTYGTFHGGAGAGSWSPAGDFFAVANTVGVWVFATDTLEQKALFTSFAAQDAGGRYGKYNVRHGFGNSLVFLDESRVASTGMGASVTIWNTHSGQMEEYFDLPEDMGFVVSLSFSPVTQLLAAGTSRGNIALLKPHTSLAPRYLLGYQGIVHDTQFSDDGRYLGAVGSSDELVIWELETFSEIDRLPSPRNTMEIERVGKQGQFLLAGDTVEVWNYLDQEKNQCITEPNLQGQKTAWFILSLFSYLPSLQQEDIVDCKRVVTISPDGLLIADMHPGAMKEVIRIIEIATEEVVKTLNPAGGMTCDLEFSPDGHHLLIANQRGVHIYNTKTWEVVRLKLETFPVSE